MSHSFPALFADQEFYEERMSVERKYAEDLAAETSWYWPNARERGVTSGELFQRRLERNRTEAAERFWEKRAEMKRSLYYINETLIPDLIVSSVPRLFGDECVRDLDFLKAADVSMSHSKLKRLRTLRECCRFYALHDSFLRRHNLAFTACPECQYASRLQWMKGQYGRAKRLAEILSLMGPFRSDTQDDAGEELSCFTDIHFTGDRVQTYAGLNIQAYSSPDTVGAYVFTPIGMMSEAFRRRFYSYASKMWEKGDGMFADLAYQMCGQAEIFDHFYFDVIRDKKPHRFERFLAIHDPARAIDQVARLCDSWKDTRKHLEQFNLEKYITRIRILIDDEKHALCTEGGCIRRQSGRSQMWKEMREDRKRGKCQLFTVNHEIPTELRDFFDQLRRGNPATLNINGSFQHKEQTWAGLITKLGLFFTNVWASWPNKTAIATAFGLLAASLDLSSKMMDWLMKHFETTWAIFTTSVPTSADGGVAQSGDGKSGCVTSIAIVLLTLVTTIVSVVVVGRLPPNGGFLNMLKNTSVLGRALQGVTTIYDTVGKLVSMAIDYLKHDLFGVPRENETTIMDMWCDEVAELRNTDLEGTIKNNLELKEKIDSLLERGDRVLKIADKLKMPMTSRTRLIASHQFLLTCRQMAATSGAGGCEPRVAPAIFHIVGSSGVGKSSILWPILAKSLVEIGCTEPTDLQTKTYFKYPNRDERWDGYSNMTKFVVCDDVFSRKDTEANPNPEVLETIRMSNTAFWQLQMAELADKGNTFFRALAVFWTSNAHAFNFESLTNPEAVERRITARYRQMPIEEYAMERMEGDKVVKVLDPEKVAAELAKDPMSITKFVYFVKEEPNLRNIVVVNPRMTYEEVSDEIVNTILRNKNYGERFNDAVSSYFVKLVDEKRAREGTQTPHPSTSQTSEVSVKDISQLVGVIEDLVRVKEECVSEPSRNAGVSQGWEEDEAAAYATLCGEVEDFERKSFHHVRKAEVKDACLEYERKWAGMRCDYDHLSITRSALNYTPLGGQNYVSASGHYMYEHDGEAYHLSELKCVKVKPQVAERFMKAWVSAKAMMDASPLGVQQKVFNDVFFHHSTMSEAQITPCFTHEGGMDFATRWARKMYRFRLAIGEEAYRSAFVAYGVARAGKWAHEHPFVTAFLIPLGLILGFGLTHWIVSKLLQLAGMGVASLTNTTRRAVKLVYQKVFHKTREDIIRDVNEEKERPFNYDLWADRLSWQECQRKTMSTPAELMSEYLNRLEDYTLDELDVVAAYAKANCINPNHQHEGVAEYGDSTKGRTVRRGTAQFLRDQNAEEMGPIVYRNLYRLQYQRSSGEWVNTTQVLFVRGRLAITNAHILALKHHREWRLVNSHTQTQPFRLWSQNHYRSPNTDDLMIIEMPEFINQHQSIVKKFMTEDDFARFTRLAQVCLYTYDAKTYALKQYFTKDFEYNPGEEFDVYNDDHVFTTMTDTLKYALPTRPGDCGGPLVAYDSNFHRKIMGIHDAGMDQPVYTGAAQRVSQEKIIALIAGLDMSREDSYLAPDLAQVQMCDVETKVSEDGTLTFVVLDPVFPNAGVAHSSSYQSPKSNIYPSRLWNIIAKPKTKPARLGIFKRADGVVVDPMRLARKKAAGVSPLLHNERLDACVNEVRQMYGRFVRPEDRRVVSWEEAIAGVPGDMCMPPLNRKTSPGYGWPKGGVGKARWLGLDDYNFSDPELVASRDRLMLILREGGRVTTLWTDALKDERRLAAKVDAGKTRMFSVGEMTFVIIFRQYFMGFVAHMVRNRIENESCVGVNVYSHEWTQLARRLQEVGPHVMAGDFSNYDGTLNAQILWRVLDIVNDFYGGNRQDSSIRASLWSEIVNSIHVCGNQIYMWNHSNPSGCPITTILNSVYHSIAARYVFLTCAMGAPGCYDLGLFRRCVRHNNYGDDDVWNISSEIIEWFNQETVTEAFRLLGMEYTDEMKTTGAVAKCRTLNEVSFLKRQFRWDSTQHRYRAPLSLDTILEMPMWVRGKVDMDPITSVTLQEAAHELAQHDRATFEKWIPDLERGRVIIDRYCPTRFHTYDHYQEIEISRWVSDLSEDTDITVRHDIKQANARVSERLPPGTSGQLQSRHRGLAQVFEPETARTQNMTDNKPKQTTEMTLEQQQELIREKMRDVQLYVMDVAFLFKARSLDCREAYNEHRARMRAELLENFEHKMEELFQMQEVLNDAFRKRGDDVRGEDVPPRRNRGTAQMDGAGDSNAGAHDTLLTTPVSEETPQQTVTFSEDGHVATREPASSHMKNYESLADDALTHAVVDFLERPLPVTDFVWTSAQVEGVSLTWMDLPWDWVRKQMIAEKVAGFKYLRTSWEIRVQVNAQPSNAGGIIIAFVPFYEQTGWLPVDILQYTGYRHVLLDVNQATSATLMIPHIHPEAYFDLTAADRKLGRVVVAVFSKLAGGTDVEGTMYIRAVDPIITLPTGIKAATTPQSALLTVQGTKRTELTDRRSGLYPRASGQAQMAREKELMQKGPVENALRATTQVSKALGDVPIIGAVAQEISWWTNIAAGVAGMFGWSRPQDSTQPCMVQQTYFRSMANFNGDSKAKTLALDMDNQQKIPHEIFQTDKDEMSISHIASIPLAVDRFSITKTTDPETHIWGRYVVAGTKQFLPEEDKKRFNPAYCDFLATYFKYWRGELVYTFKIFKTAFHSCRIRITYIPGLTKNQDFVFEKCYTEVYDIRERTDIEFRVPFAYHKAWAARGVEIPGFISVDLVNSLRNPSICADSIDIVVYKHAGPDFQVAVPAKHIMRYWYLDKATNKPVDFRNINGTEWNGIPDNTPVGEDTNQLVGIESRGTRNTGVAQMNSEPVEQSREPDLMREPSTLIRVKGMPEYTPNALATGEAITSLRQLLKRYELYTFQTAPKPTLGARFNPHLPWSVGPRTTDAYFGIETWMGCMSLLYRFQCGSVMIGWHNKTQTRDAQVWAIEYAAGSRDPIPVYDMTHQRPSVYPLTVFQPEESAFEVRVPHYISLPVRLTPTYFNTKQPDETLGAEYDHNPFLLVSPYGIGYLSRAVGEDFSFGYLLPPPQMQDA